MATWKPEEALNKKMLGHWPQYDYFDFARKEKQDLQKARRRRRFWRENGEYILRVVTRATRAISA